MFKCHRPQSWVCDDVFVPVSYEESIFQEPVRILNTHLTYKKDTPQHLLNIIRITY